MTQDYPSLFQLSEFYYASITCNWSHWTRNICQAGSPIAIDTYWTRLSQAYIAPFAERTMIEPVDVFLKEGIALVDRRLVFQMQNKYRITEMHANMRLDNNG